MRRVTPGTPVRTAGFTIVELMVTLAVVAILAAIAVPTMRNVIENSHIKATGQSLQNGLAMARAEAVRLNTQVRFTLNAGGWDITRVDGTGPNAGLLQQASGKELASGTIVVPSSADAIIFDALGRLSSGPAQIDIEATNPSGTPSYKPLRVQLTASGLARLCNPDPELPSTDPKACL